MDYKIGLFAPAGEVLIILKQSAGKRVDGRALIDVQGPLLYADEGAEKACKLYSEAHDGLIIMKAPPE